jgi:hypothetical protein
VVVPQTPSWWLEDAQGEGNTQEEEITQEKGIIQEEEITQGEGNTQEDGNTIEEGNTPEGANTQDGANTEETAEEENLEAPTTPAISQSSVGGGRKCYSTDEEDDIDGLASFLNGNAGQFEEDNSDDNDWVPTQPHKRRRTDSLGISKTSSSKRLSSSRKPKSSPRRPPSLHTLPTRTDIPSPPSSHISEEAGEVADGIVAMFEEWPLDNVVLKRVIENGRATFQLQFTWDLHAKHVHGSHLAQSYGQTKKRRSTTRRAASRVPFTPEEDSLLTALKGEALPWQEIYERFKDAFPLQRRSLGSLQVRYCTKLKTK